MLSAGANVGAVQVGMLQRLADAGVMPDRVFGASVGSLNAAAFAADPTVEGMDRLATMWRSLRGDDVFPPAGPRRRSMVYQHARHSGAGVGRIVDSLALRRIEDVEIPLEIAVTSIRGRGRRWLNRGSLSTALRASTAIPGLLPPVRIGSDLCFDGAVTDRAPIDRAVACGMRRIVILEAAGAPSPGDVGRRLVDGMTNWVRRHGHVVPDDVEVFVIRAGSEEPLHYTDFTHTNELIEEGHFAAEIALSELEFLTAEVHR